MILDYVLWLLINTGSHPLVVYCQPFNSEKSLDQLRSNNNQFDCILYLADWFSKSKRNVKWKIFRSEKKRWGRGKWEGKCFRKVPRNIDDTSNCWNPSIIDNGGSNEYFGNLCKMSSCHCSNKCQVNTKDINKVLKGTDCFVHTISFKSSLAQYIQPASIKIEKQI